MITKDKEFSSIIRIEFNSEINDDTIEEGEDDEQGEFRHCSSTEIC